MTNIAPAPNRRLFPHRQRTVSRRIVSAMAMAAMGVVMLAGHGRHRARAAPPADERLAPPAAAPSEAPDSRKAPLDARGATLRRRLDRLVAAGKLDEALRAADEALANRASPVTPGERREVIDLHISVASRLFERYDYSQGEKLLERVLAQDDQQPDARAMLTALAEARRQTPAMLERASQMIAIERYEPAVRIIKKAVALLPERESQWARPLGLAHAGAADQHYRLGNWAASLPHYAAASRGGWLDPTAQRRHVQAALLVACDWLKVGRLPEAVVGETLAAGVATLTDKPDPILTAMLAAVQAEYQGQNDRALAAYAAVMGRPAPPAGRVPKAGELAAARAEAVGALRQTLDKLGPESRPPLWSQSLPGPAMTRQTERFVILHHNDRLARRVADALEFHFVELLNDWQLPLEKFVAWHPKPRVHIHRNQAEYRAAIAKLGVGDFVPALSLKPAPGRLGVEPVIHTYQDHPGLLSSLLAHELAHLMIAHAAGHPAIPTALDEGLALLAEPEPTRLFYYRLAIEIWGVSGPMPLAEMLGAGPPANAQEATRFYARSLLLAEYLRRRLPPDKLLAAVAEMGTVHTDADVRLPLARAMGLPDGAALEADWQANWKR